MRLRRIGLAGLARRAPLTAARAFRPRWVNVPTNLRCPAHLQHLPGDFAASPSVQCSTVICTVQQMKNRLAAGSVKVLWRSLE